jgi:hypothetical protein
VGPTTDWAHGLAKLGGLFFIEILASNDPSGATQEFNDSAARRGRYFGITRQ